MSSWAFAVSFTLLSVYGGEYSSRCVFHDNYCFSLIRPLVPRMRVLAKKLFYSLVLVAWVRGSATSFDEDLVEEELDKRDTGNITLKAPIIGVVSEDW
jgi:hypothetical protein